MSRAADEHPHRRRPPGDALLIRGIVREASRDIVECEDGSDALAAYAAHRPDWVLMDVEMPGMDGLRATEAITAEYPEARVVIVAQYADASTRAAADAAGAVGFVSKDDLTGLRSLLGSRGPAG